MPRVLIADSLSPAAVDIFRQRGVDVDIKTGLSKDELIAVIGDYDGLVVRSDTKPNKDVIAAAKRLKVIGRAGIGVDNIDIPAATAAGVVVMNTPFGNSITTAEHAIAMMFALARQMPAADASTQAGKWEKSRFMGVELYAKTLGLPVGDASPWQISVLSKALGLPLETTYPLAVAPMPKDFLVELDEYPAPATPRPVRTGSLPAGPAMVSFGVEDLADFKANWRAQPARIAEFPYSGQEAAVVVGPAGEWVELVEIAGLPGTGN